MAGPGLWAVSFFLCSLGFLFWSGVVPLAPWHFYLAGEAAHIGGFLALLYGIFRFTDGTMGKPQWVFLGFWAAFWLGSLALAPSHLELALLLLKLSRVVLFLAGGFLILTRIPNRSLAGRQLAGWGLVAWAAYLATTGFVRLPESLALSHLTFGFLVGFQAVAALGLVVLVVDQWRLRAEDSEKRAGRLEGLLPICCYCKKIRDPNDRWHPIEEYIRDRSPADFSHGVCPDCARANFPEPNPEPPLPPSSSDL